MNGLAGFSVDVGVARGEMVVAVIASDSVPCAFDG
jgi:hypothetical protein